VLVDKQTKEVVDAIMLAIGAGLHLYEHKDELKNKSPECLAMDSFHAAEEMLNIETTSQHAESIFNSLLRNIERMNE
jgi:hypothetical protein